MPKLTPELYTSTLDPVFLSKWRRNVLDAFADYLLEDYEAAIRLLVSQYGMTFEEMQAETDSVASKEWGFDQITADYFFLMEDFNTETGDFLR